MSGPEPAAATLGGVAGHDATRRVARDLQQVVRSSVADATEILWMQRRFQRIAVRAGAARTGSWMQRTVEVRVMENGKLGQHRLGSADPGEIAAAARRALAHARGENLPGAPLMHQPESVPRVEAFDRRLARLAPAEAEDLLDRRCGADGAAILEWSDGRCCWSTPRDWS